MKHSKVWAPASVRSVRIAEKTKLGEYLVVDGREALLALIQMDVLELHTWNSTVERLEEPDRLVLDLDPGPRVRFAEVVAAARLVRDALAALGLAAFVKTTGGAGLHVVVPLAPLSRWEECLAFARAFAARDRAPRPAPLHRGLRQGRAGAEDPARLPAQQPDEHLGRGVLDAGAAGRARVGAARLGRARAAAPAGTLHRRDRPAPAAPRSAATLGGATTLPGARWTTPASRPSRGSRPPRRARERLGGSARPARRSLDSRVTRIRVGTSGYMYRHWRGVLYPEGLAQRLWLPRYASFFDTVEMNATFYRLPTPRAVERWRDAVPAGFTFAVKGSRYLTHLKLLLDADEGLAPLLRADRAVRREARAGAVAAPAPPEAGPRAARPLPLAPPPGPPRRRVPGRGLVRRGDLRGARAARRRLLRARRGEGGAAAAHRRVPLRALPRDDREVPGPLRPRGAPRLRRRLPRLGAAGRGRLRLLQQRHRRPRGARRARRSSPSSARSGPTSARRRDYRFTVVMPCAW